MRRLVKHGIAGVGFVACTVTVAVAALGDPAGSGSAIAVPAPVVSISAAATPSAVDPTAATRSAARDSRESRDAARAQLTAAATQQAVKRASTLGLQRDSIEAEQVKILADQIKAKAAAKAEAERAAEAKAQARAAAAAGEKEEAAERKAAAEKRKAAANREAAEKKAAEKKAKAKAVRKRGYSSDSTNPREIAKQILANKFGYGPEQYSCFKYIIDNESDWKINARNPSSGAYGIPQALPGSKMASAGSDWRTNPATQITWAIGYMNDRYGSPCQARSFKAANGWY